MSTAAFLTDFADQAVLLPVAIAVGFGLAFSGWKRGAEVWTLAVGAALAATLVLKLIFTACGPLILDGILQSPSGHTAAAAAIYGGLAALVVRRFAGGMRPASVAAGLIAFGIGATRLALGVHTYAEVLAGAAVGIAAALAIARWAGPPPPLVRLTRVVLIAAAIALLLHGIQLPAEAAIRQSMLLHLWPLSACTS